MKEDTAEAAYYYKQLFFFLFFFYTGLTMYNKVKIYLLN